MISSKDLNNDNTYENRNNCRVIVKYTWHHREIGRLRV
jgi:hypothetical protein